MLFGEQKTASPESIMLQASMGATLSKAISTVAKLNIADLLVDGSKDACELADLTGTNAQLLYRLLRFLSAFGIFTEDQQHHFSLTPLSATLRTDSPTSTREWIVFNTEPWRWEIVQSMMDVISNGKNAYENLYKENAYDFFYSKPEIGMAFGKAMNSWSSSLPIALLKAYNFSNIKTLVDVGGGFGNLLFPILKAYPEIQAILFDLPAVAQEASKLKEYKEVENNCAIVEGNFFISIPERCDLYMFATVLMDNTDEECLKILANCYSAMNKNSKLLIIEQLEGSSYQSSIGKFVDIMMMLETYGRIREEEEWKSLLQQANFTITNIIPIDALSTYIIEAVPNL